MQQIIALNRNDLRIAHRIATQRHEVNIKAGRNNAVIDSQTANYQGCICELAIAYHFSIPWDGQLFTEEQWQRWRTVGRDVGPLEVRGTTHATGRLIIQPQDKNDSPFVLCRINTLDNEHALVIVAGWAFGAQAKKKEYWQDVGHGRPCYYLPNDKLRQIDELKEKMKQAGLLPDQIMSKGRIDVTLRETRSNTTLSK